MSLRSLFSLKWHGLPARDSLSKTRAGSPCHGRHGRDIKPALRMTERTRVSHLQVDRYVLSCVGLAGEDVAVALIFVAQPVARRHGDAAAEQLAAASAADAGAALKV